MYESSQSRTPAALASGRRGVTIGATASGDELLYEIIDERVILTKARRGTPTDDPFRTFEEWSSEADTTAYADL